ncbi:hypothetical protein [Thauera sinica]|uniref:Uncharacterized protein n=1 Tax=Thauera sinica TaxID=2665146 RepID=A0ABW1AP69_9RHOO|nr:hypothetical protein [Thauera sp. K11]
MNPNGNNSSFPWFKILIALQVLAFACLFNPWSPIIRGVAVAIFAVEISFFVLWAFPVFIYQWLKKKKTLKESARIAIASFLEAISFV